MTTINYTVYLVGANVNHERIARILNKISTDSLTSGIWNFTISETAVEGTNWNMSGPNPWPINNNSMCIFSYIDYPSAYIGLTYGGAENSQKVSVSDVFDNVSTEDFMRQRILHELLHKIPGGINSDLMNSTPEFASWCSLNNITLTDYPTPVNTPDRLDNLLHWDEFLCTKAKMLLSPPVANFTVSATTIAVTQSISGTDTSTGNPTSWLWELGDGAVTRLKNLPWYYYNTAGTYTLKLTVSNANGSNSKTQTITVNSQFTQTPTLPKYPHNINTNSNNYVYGVQFDEGAEGGTFHDTTPTNEGVAYDGRTESVDTELLEYTGNAPSPTFSHNIAYIRDGEWLKYTVTVNTTGNYNFEYCYASPAVGRSIYIYVDDVLKQTCVLPSTGSFTAWSVYKSKYNSQSALNLTAGTHVIKILFAGESQNMLWFNFEYEAAQPVVLTPVAAFSSDVTTGTKPTPVMFTDKSSNNPTSWLWNFGDGITSSVRNPNHIYETSGIYTVTLTATNSAGSDIEVKPSYIVVKDPVVVTVTKPVSMLSWDSTTAIVGDATVFLDHSENSPTSWLWNFGDGQTSTTRNPTHTYLNSGTYSVSLTATNAGGSNTYTHNVEITAPILVNPTKPVASFKSSPISGNYTLPQTVIFQDTSVASSSSPITSWLWDFGDGNTSTSQNPTHTYNSASLYTVTLTATNSAGSTVYQVVGYFKISTPVEITPIPVAMMSWDTTTAVVGKSTIFQDHSTNSPTSWLWNFGDNQTSTNKNPVHTYSVAGTYTVSLTVSNAGGSNTYTHSIEITAPVVILPTNHISSFKSNPVSGNYTTPQTVAFQDTSVSPSTITSWVWNFGDGNTSTEKNPTHTYTEPGLYTVQLLSIDENGPVEYKVTNCFNITETATPTDPIPVTAPVADAYIHLSSLTVPCVATCTDRSTNNPDSWLWNFDDGSTSTEQNPTHTYVTAGVYTLRLTVANRFNISYVTKTLNLAEAVDGKPKSYFTCSPASGEIDVGTTVQFFDSTPETLDAPNLRWQWFFGDEGYSEEKNPVHKFTKTGTFTVRLMVTNKNGFNSYSIQDCFVVNEVYTAEPIHAAFRAFPSSGNLPLTVTFINDSTGPYEFCDWDFGDGGTSNKINGKHTYVGDEAKDYTVTLTVTTLDGRTSTETIFNCVEASEPLVPSGVPTVDFEADIVGCDTTQQIQFTNLSYGGDITNVVWHFGLDNMTATTQDAMFRYYSPGTYTVRLDVTINGTVYSHEKRNYIYVTPEATEPPTAGFSSDIVTGVAPLMVNFVDTSEHYPCSWIWNFGDGTYSTARNPSHQYTEGGLYTVTLTAKNKIGVDQLVKTGNIEVLTTSVVNKCYTGTYEHNCGLLTTRIDNNAEGYNQTYRPNAIRCNYGTYEVSIARLTAAQSEDSQVGLTFNTNEVLRIDSNKNYTGLPISGYGVYLDCRYNSIRVKRFGNSIAPVELKNFSIDALSINKFYTLKVERLVDGYIKVYLDDENIGNVYDTTYTNDGCSGIIIYSKNNGEEFAFDDFVISSMTYAHTSNASVYMGGVSHGGKFNKINTVEDKFIAGSQFPLGKYYGEVCARANTDVGVIIDYKNFTRDRPITYETYDNLNDISELKKSHVELGTNKSICNMKIDLDSTNDKGCICGIVVRENDTAYKRNYKPVVVIEYIALAPVASNANESMFPQDIAMMCYTKPSTYQKLENKRVC